ncbi:MAG: hypothetical protein SGILL_010860, partial [Bacillariaceae sp.]
QVLLCHCSQCRRSSGAHFIPYVALQRQGLMHSIHGDDTANVHEQWGTIELSKAAKRNFCKNCGSLICMDYHAPNTVWVPLGILDGENDESGSLNPAEWIDSNRDSQIFVEDRVPWMDKMLETLPLKQGFGTYKADVCGDIPFEDLPPWEDDTEN